MLILKYTGKLFCSPAVISKEATPSVFNHRADCDVKRVQNKYTSFVIELYLVQGMAKKNKQ